MLSGSKAHLQSMAELDEILRVQGCFKTVFLLCCSKIFLHLPYSADWVGGFWGSHSYNYVKPEAQWLDHPTSIWKVVGLIPNGSSHFVPSISLLYLIFISTM